MGGKLSLNLTFDPVRFPTSLQYKSIPVCGPDDHFPPLESAGIAGTPKLEF